jgi:hypothetical protein
MIILIFRHEQAFCHFPERKRVGQLDLSDMRFTFRIGMLEACRGDKKNFAAYGRKAV